MLGRGAVERESGRGSCGDVDGVRVGCVKGSRANAVDKQRMPQCDLHMECIGVCVSAYVCVCVCVSACVGFQF